MSQYDNPDKDYDYTKDYTSSQSIFGSAHDTDYQQSQSTYLSGSSAYETCPEYCIYLILCLIIYYYFTTTLLFKANSTTVDAFENYKAQIEPTIGFHS